MERTEYSTDLTDKQWEMMAPLLIISSGSKAGRPLKLELREIINAILYLIHTGCQWRELPHDFPLWNSVYYHFSKYKKNGTWERIHREIHSGLREESGKKPEPSAAIIDSQSVKASQMVKTKGFDGNKKVKGKKYHIVVDTIGFPLLLRFMMQISLMLNRHLQL